MGLEHENRYQTGGGKMKKMIICLAIIVSITAMTGDKNKNFGKWSIERFGLRIRAYTNKKEYSLDEKIIVKFDFKHANKERCHSAVHELKRWDQVNT